MGETIQKVPKKLKKKHVFRHRLIIFFRNLLQNDGQGKVLGLTMVSDFVWFCLVSISRNDPILFCLVLFCLVTRVSATRPTHCVAPMVE